MAKKKKHDPKVVQEKPITFDAVMLLSEFQLEQIFPHGASLHEKKGKPDRYSPCPKGTRSAKTLNELLKEKNKRREPIYYLRRSYNVPRSPKGSGSEDNYTTIPAQALGVDKHGRGTPEISLPPVVLDAYAEENWQRFMAGLEATGARNPKLYIRRRFDKKAA